MLYYKNKKMEHKIDKIDKTVFESLNIYNELLKGSVLETNDSELLFTFIHTTINEKDPKQTRVLESFRSSPFINDLTKTAIGVNTLSDAQRKVIEDSSGIVNGGGPIRLKRRKKSTRRKSSKKLRKLSRKN